MHEAKLYEILESILNRASRKDLEVLRLAIEKREAALGQAGPAGVSPGDMVQQTADTISEQMSYSVDSIRGMVRDFVRDIIKQNAPELDAGQIDQVLEEYVGSGEDGAAQTGEGERHSPLPKDVLYSMLEQFISYATGKMTITQQEQLESEMSDWYQRYWDSFPRPIQLLLSRYLKGEMDARVFWHAVEAEI
ncbi:MAG: hypothetical protein K9L68_05775 [Spirochaetales bacterium]|nr:hypothetical protein [Spirochaetales bacterium]MCF7938089.1 hypothetical protein [Spirochaetales bacterium]